MTTALTPFRRRTGLDACADALHACSDVVIYAGGEGARRLFMAVRAAEHDPAHAPRMEAHGEQAGAVVLGEAAAGHRVALLASGPDWVPRVVPALREAARLGLPALVVVPAHGEEGGDALPRERLDDATRLLDGPICVGVAGSSEELGPSVRAMAAHARTMGRPCATVFALGRVGLAGVSTESDAELATNAVTLHGDHNAPEVIVGAGEDLRDALARIAASGGPAVRAVRVNRLRPGLRPALSEALLGARRVTVYEPFPDAMGDEGWLTTRVHRAVEGRAAVNALVRGDPADSSAFEDDETRALTLMPLEVRRRLDTVGLRVSLAAWQAMDLITRAALRDLPLDDDGARADLAARVRAACDAVAMPPKEESSGARSWDAPEAWARVSARAAAAGVALDLIAWHGLHPEHRFALDHLASPKRDLARFRAALVASGAAPW